MSRVPCPTYPLVRVRGLVAADAAALRQALIALGLNSTTSLIAGGILAAITGTFERYPGLLVLVPAAIGLRGNIFSAVGARLSTAIHTGTLRFSTRRESVFAQNVIASIALSLGLSLVLAVLAKVIAVALGIENSINIGDLIVVSVVGGLLASALVLAATVGVAGGAVRYGWDLDNVSAPVVSTVGDVLTLPALWLATGLIGISIVTPTLAVVLSASAIVVMIVSLRSKLEGLRRIVRESLPVLAVACAVSSMAGVAVEKQFGAFTRYPALLVLLPAFLSSAGALGGILSGRVGSKLHLGLVLPAALPSREARRDVVLVALLAIPVFVFNGAAAHLVATALDHASPGLVQMEAVSLIGGALAVAFALMVAYYGTVASFRLGLDPDTYGIPLVTSTLDLVGAFSLVLIVVALGLD